MRRKIVNIIRVVTSFLCLLCLFAAFKCSPKRDATKLATDTKPTAGAELPIAALKREFGNSLPFPIGEKHEFEIRYSRFPLYATVGTITFEFLGPVMGEQIGSKLGDLNVEFKPDPSEKFLHFRGRAVSKGILVAIVGVDVKDQYETLIDERDFSARLSFKEIKEGKKHTTQTSLYDREQQSIKFQLNDLTKPQSSPRQKTFERKDGTVDILTAFYFTRLQKLKEGQLLRFPVSDDDQNYEFDIVVGKREKISTDCGKVRTIRLEPKIFGPGKFFSRTTGEMTMWVTDDDKHVPLRLVAKTSSGTLSAKLLNFKNKCNIIEPDPESKDTKQSNSK